MPSPKQSQRGHRQSLLIVAGEASGDAYGAALIHTLREHLPHLQSYGLGGEQMRAAGVETLFDIKALNVVGALEACAKVPQGVRMAHRLLKEARCRNTQVAVLVDAPGFNLALARRLKRADVRVVYYVSPQIWAWRPGRVKQIARCVDKMLTLFPFEVPFYTAAGVDAEWVGHPLIERLHHLPAPEEAAKACGLDPRRPIVALLPGSRRQEIRRLLPPILGAMRYIKQRLPQVQGLLPLAPTVSYAEIRQVARHFPPEVTIMQGQSGQALRAATFAIVASGTATLEAGCLGTPMVVVYKVHPVTAWLAKRLLRVPYIGLVNIVAGRQIVPELAQRRVQPQRMAAYALRCLEHPQEARRIKRELNSLRYLMARSDGARRAAVCVQQFLSRHPGAAPLPHAEAG